MFADLMNFDNLRRNILEFVAIIEINFATDGHAVFGKNLFLCHYIEGILGENDFLTPPLTLSRDGRSCSLGEH